MSSTPPISGSNTAAPNAPPRVPDHDLIRRIGRGAYGEVWLARSVTGAFRAVKIVHRSSFDRDRPFQREFEGIQKFEPISRRHESQVDILHVGRNGDCFYYVMELADDQATGGQILPDQYAPRTLKSDLTFRTRLPFEEVVSIGIALTTALQHLHENGLVHRDVKPSNIIFVNGVAKLADIGLVTGVDTTRSYVGTEGFAAPEGPGTPQADLYGLGKVLYETCTGRDRQEFPELPTDLRELPDREGLMELNAVIARACRHDPKDRYVSAAAMRVDLELLQSGKSLARLHRVEEQLRWVRRTGALVTALAALIASGWLWQARQTRVVGALAEERTALAQEKTALAEEVRRHVVRLGTANGIAEMDRGDLGRALSWLTDALKRSTNHPTESARQRVRIRQLLARHPRLLNVFPHPAAVRDVAFSPDQQRVATACEDSAVRIWELDRVDGPWKRFQLSGPVSTVRFTRDGRRLFVVELNSTNQPKRVSLLDAETGRWLWPPIPGITSAGLSPDDRWLAVARPDHTVMLISSATGETMAQAIGHEDRIEGIDFAPDSARLVTASRDRTARIWAVPGGGQVGEVLRHSLPVVQAVFNPMGTRIATVTAAEFDNNPFQFQTWDVATGRAVGQPIRGEGLHALVAFDPAGIRLLTADRRAQARVWHTDSHHAIGPPLLLEGAASCVGFSPDGAWIAVGNNAGVVRIWDDETGTEEFSPLRNSGRTRTVRFSDDCSLLLTGGDDGSVRVWDLALEPTDRSRWIPSIHRPTLAQQPDGRHLLMGMVGAESALHLVDMDRREEGHTALPSGTNYYPASKVRVDRTGDQWVTGFGPLGYLNLTRNTEPRPGVVGLWRREESRLTYSDLPHPSAPREVFFHRNGRQLLTASDDRVARIWRTSDGTLLESIRWPESDAAWIGVNPELDTAIVLCGDERDWRMAFREIRTGRTLRECPEINPGITALAYSPDGTRVGLVGFNQSGRIYDARSGEPLTPWFKHGGRLTCLEWSPDGSRVLTAGLSPEVKVWYAATGELALPPLVMKVRPVETARFSPDGRMIVARSDEDWVRVWDAATGEAITPFLFHPDTVRDAFITREHKVVSVQNSGELRTWELNEQPDPAGDLADYAQLLAGGVIETSGLIVPTELGRIADIMRSLRLRQPEWFVHDPQRLHDWHHARARTPRTLNAARVARFHLERLAQMSSDDADLQEQLRRCRRLEIVPRAAGTPRALIDLDHAYTTSPELFEHGALAKLPRGRVRLAGTEFDLRGLIRLDHRAERADAQGPFHPQATVEIGMRCRKLHFLQATVNGPLTDGTVCARWIMEYADGTSFSWPVIYGDQLRELMWLLHLEPLEARQAAVAWQAETESARDGAPNRARLFRASWENPRPEIELRRVELSIGETSALPIVVAITAEPGP